MTPLFSIELLSNQSYILQLNFSPPRAKNGSDASDLDAFGITESPVVIKQAFLTLVVEDRGFHTAMFYLKCFCVPFILGGKSNFLARKGHRQKFLRTGAKFLLIAWFWVNMESICNICLILLFLQRIFAQPFENETQIKSGKQLMI